MTKERDLTLKIRPRRFSEVVGQSETLKVLQTQLKTSVPLAIMLVGPPGTGKTTTARILAISLNCTHSEVIGEPCDACIESNDFEIDERNAADVGKVDDARELLEGLDYFPAAGKYRVIILDECQQMTDAAQNVLLKPMEQEKSFNVFVLCTTDPGKIIKAVKSRAKTYQMKELGNDFVLELVVKASMAVGEQDPTRIRTLANALIENEVRGPRDIVGAVEKYAAGASLEMAIVPDGETLLDFNAIARAVLDGQWNVACGLMASAAATDATNLRIRVGGYLRKVLMSNHNKAPYIADALIKLAQISAYESGIQLSATTAILYQLATCQVRTYPGASNVQATATNAAPFGLKK